MECIRAGLFRGGEDGVDIEVAGACRRRTDPDGFVGGFDMWRICIRI
jgi:hypothetical protein